MGLPWGIDAGLPEHDPWGAQAPRFVKLGRHVLGRGAKARQGEHEEREKGEESGHAVLSTAER